jgi:hypothetical protein
MPSTKKLKQGEHMHKRTGFYPASANDYLEPLQLLKEYIDHMIFCDLNIVPNSKSSINDLRRKIATEGLPEASFFLGDALNALSCIQPVDVFFLRRDSGEGEGGSNLALLRSERISLVTNAIKPGGIIVTDKPNGFLWLTRMLSGKSPTYIIGDRVLSLSHTQPWINIELYSVKVS